MTKKMNWLPGLAKLLTAVMVLALSACGGADTPGNVPGEARTGEGPEQATVAPTPQSIPAPPDVAGIPDDAQRSASGLAWKVLLPGEGSERPGPGSQVEVHYSGWTTDGVMFDSSRVRGESSVLPLNRVIAGWTEGVQMMVEGEQRRFWIPAELAYANSTRRDAPQGMLVFDIELIAIKD